MRERLKKWTKRIFLPLWLIALIYFNFLADGSFFNLLGQRKKQNSLATVIELNQDVRRKESASLDFSKAKKNDLIFRGDSISTGQKSTAIVNFKSGEKLSIDQNSLIVFDEETDTPEFVTGNIKLTVNGKMKIKVDKEIIELNGENSDIQIFKDTQTSSQKIVLLKGSAEVKSTKNNFRLQQNIQVETKKILVKATDILNTPAPKVDPAPTPVLVQAPPPAPKNYRIYDVYQKKLGVVNELATLPNFVSKPNYVFEKFQNATIQVEKNTALFKPNDYPFQFHIQDDEKVMGYIVEISKAENFAPLETRILWTKSQFEHHLSEPGLHFLRYRKVLADQILTDYSSPDQVNVPAYIPPPVLTQKPKPIPKKVTSPKETVFEKPKEIPREPAEVIVEKTDLAPDQNYQSVIQVQPEVPLRNQNYKLSSLNVFASQSYLASGRQIANASGYSQSYNLGFDLTHWFDQQGARATFDQGLVTKNSANKITFTELTYMYRFSPSWSVADGGTLQTYVGGGIENYQNSQNTTDFVSSYNLFRLGLGASMPVFTFWSLDADAFYGFGSDQKTSLLLSGKANYYFTPKISLGLGFRARKFDYYIVGQKNMESLSETFTTIRMHY